MTEPNKTTVSDAAVPAYLAAIDDVERRQDCQTLITLMSKVTKEEPKMWGAGIVGFGSYHYKYDSGREGDSCLVGLSSRKSDISVYLVGAFEGRETLLAELGKHKTAKACLYVNRVSDIRLPVLEKLVAGSVAERKRRYPLS